jgi:hypothetical protein
MRQPHSVDPLNMRGSELPCWHDHQGYILVVTGQDADRNVAVVVGADHNIWKALPPLSRFDKAGHQFPHASAALVCSRRSSLNMVGKLKKNTLTF